ncbi:MAG: hypothetical protein AB7V46_07205 [Thermomicrobiales bacterium]
MAIASDLAIPAEAQDASGTIEFRHEEGVPLEYRQQIEEGVLLGRNYLRQVWGMELTDPLLVESLASDGVPGFATKERIVFNTGSPGWIDTTPAQRIKIGVHEFWHAAVETIDPRNGALDWMNEGTADYFAFSAVVEQGIIDPDVAWAFHRLQVFHAPEFVPLEQLAANFAQSAGPVYSISYLAVENLVQQHGVGAIRNYFELTAQGYLRHDAFRETFGQGIDEFYAEFTAFRANLLNPQTLITQLIPPGPVLEYPAYVAIYSASTPIEAGAQALVTAGTDPSVRCYLDVYTVDGTLLESRPTQADPAGIAFWFWTIGPEYAGQQLPLAARCGGDPAWTAIDVT